MAYVYVIGAVLSWIVLSFVLVKRDYLRFNRPHLEDIMVNVLFGMLLAIIWFVSVPGFILGLTIQEVLSMQEGEKS